MDKTAIIGAIAATGVVAMTAPAAFLASGAGSTTKTLIPRITSAKDIKGKYKEVGCLNSYFGKIEFDTTKPRTPKPGEVNKFSANSQSCLLVEYDKQEYKEDKWKGEFRLIWVIKDETKGLITVTNARTKDEDGKLWGNSTAYVLRKNGSENSWITSHIQEIDEKWKNEEGLKNLIPQSSKSLLESIDTTKYWGFDPNLQKICGKNNCTETKGEKILVSRSWEFIASDDGVEINSWTSSRISHWFQKIFAWNGFENKISAVKKGKWQTKTNW